MILASCFRVLKCILSGSTEFNVSKWCKHSLTVSSSSVGKASLSQILLVGLGNWVVGMQVLPVKTVFSYWVLCPNGQTFANLHFTASVTTEALLCPSHSSLVVPPAEF